MGIAEAIPVVFQGLQFIDYQEGVPMTKADLVSQVAKQSKLTVKATEAVLKSLIGAVHQALKDDGEIRISALGTFKVLERKPRTGRNPRTGSKMTIPAMRVISFRPTKSVREAAKKTEKKKK